MNRLQKKCFMAVAGMHLFLLLILFFGSGFFSPKNKADNLPVLDFVPLKTIDEAFSGGGNRNANPPPVAAVAPAAPAASRPQPISQPTPTPAPRPEPPKPVKPNSESLEPVKPPKHPIAISTTPVVRGQKEIDKARIEAEKEQASQAAEDRRRLASAIGQTVTGIKRGLSPSTSIELQGPDSGGIPYGNFLAAVKKAYSDPWNVPDGVTDNVAATVSVTIARDGTVISARIVKPSGNAAVDRSVQSVLDRVKYAAPLPEGAKENQRTVNIVFDVSAKLLG